ncbi:MAG: DUF305 domain-containing protein [Balneolales bacterium]
MNYRSILVRSSFRVAFAFLLLAGVAACKSTDNINADASLNDKFNQEAIYWARVDSSRMAFIDADVDFMTGMIGHHAQALIISRLAPKKGAGREIKTLAARIINAQDDEISTMQQWLRDRGQAVPEVHIDGLNLMVHGADDHHSGHMDMPGMLSQEQLQKLDNVQGIEFERLFLNYMIEHHKGAVIMVNDLFSIEGAAQGEEAFRLASDIQVDQITEIDRMEQMLKERASS